MKLTVLALLLVTAATPALAEVASPKVERTAADRLIVTWTDDEPVDVYVADRPDAAIGDAKLVSGKNKAGKAEVTASALRPYILLRDGGDGAVTHTAERALPLVHGSNFRDVGGYPAAGGKHVKWGRIFRSGASAMLTEQDLAQVNGLGLVDLVDLRSSEERAVAPTSIQGVRYSAVGYSMTRINAARPVARDEKADLLTSDRMRGAYEGFPALLAPQMKILFAKLLADEGPLAYNCSAGQDRTGFATALILTALGVPREVIFADYHLSTTYRQPAYEMPKLNPAMAEGNPGLAYFVNIQKDPRAARPMPLFDGEQKPYLAAAFAEIEAKWGSVEAYLDKELGVDAADIARLRTEYLE